MKVQLSGEERPISMFDLSGDELFDYVDNYPAPELMGGKLADAFKRGSAKIKAKVQKVVKKGREKYKTLPKWAKVATAIVGAPLMLPAIAPVLPMVGKAVTVGKLAAIPALQAKLIQRARLKRIEQQKKLATPAVSTIAPVYQQQIAPEYQQQIVPEYQQQIAPEYQQQIAPEYQQQIAPVYQQQIAPQSQEQSKSKIMPWIIGAASLLPFFL